MHPRTLFVTGGAGYIGRALVDVPAIRRDLRAAVVVACWLPLGLLLDVGAGAAQQLAVGAATWFVLLALLGAETRAVRAQVAVAVAVATALEYTLSPALGFYAYRLPGVPAFVPPGHGLVYLAALALGRCEVPVARRRRAVWLALAFGGAWAVWGVTLARRTDALGALLYPLLAAFLLAGRAPLVYAAAFAVTGGLELLGTALGAWTWAPHDPAGLLSVGNPPSGIAGGYCVVDAVALAAVPAARRLAGRAAAGRATLGIRHPARGA